MYGMNNMYITCAGAFIHTQTHTLYYDKNTLTKTYSKTPANTEEANAQRERPTTQTHISVLETFTMQRKTCALYLNESKCC